MADDKEIIRGLQATLMVDNKEVIRNLQATLGRMEIALGAIREAILWTSEEGTVTWCNKSFDTMVGLPHISILGAKVEDVFPLENESGPISFDQHPCQILQKAPFLDEATYIFRSGEKSVSLEISGSSIEMSSANKFVILTIHDISALKLSQKELKKAKEDLEIKVQERTADLLELNIRYQNILIEAVDGIITIDTEGIIKSFNPAAEKIFGYSETEVLGKNVKLLMPSPERENHDRYIQNYLESGTKHIIGIGREVVGLRRDGSEVPLELAVSESVAKDTRLFTGLLRDISKRIEAENALREAKYEAENANRLKSDFLARMSHEIRTPMNGVLGMTELLQGTQLDGKQQRFAKTIYESAESLLSIINDILDFSKMEAGKLRLESIEVDLHNLLEETVDGLANLAYGKGLELNNSLPSNLTTLVETDPGRLRQVLTNLLGNAIKFTEQGEVTLKAGARHIDSQRVEVLFEVLDSGIGIDPAKQKDIFDSFTQEDGSTTRLYGGTGLGLAISKQIVNLMGGDLKVESVPGEGSTFSFALVMNKGVEAESRTSTQPQFVAGVKLLIVDDNATNREILEHQLEGWQAYTDSAASATEALKVLEDAVSSGDPHDLAILDMHMPRTDGMALARAIRENPNLSDLKLLILSSVATPASDQDLVDLRIAGQLTKPVRQSQLYDSLVVVLGGEMVAHTHSKGTIQSAKALTGHVLLAEDNLVNQVVAVGMLEEMGITVSVASNGREAVHEACSGAFAAILMDCQMPEMDGFQATREIRAAESESGKSPIPIVALTANALKGDREQCLAAGMSEYVAKPFTSEQLHSVLSLYLQPSNGIRQPDLSTPAAERTTTITLSETEPPIDSSVLEGISRYQKLGAPSIVDKVVTVYLETSRDATDKLRDAVKRTNATLLRECAHALKSSSANVGAMGLADLCKRLEVLAREGDLTTASKIHECLEREYERVVTALKRERAATAI